VQNCNGVDEAAAESDWPLQVEETGPSKEVWSCGSAPDQVGPRRDGFHCDIEADISNLGNHHYEISLVSVLCVNDTRILNVTWEIQSSRMEIEHSDI